VALPWFLRKCLQDATLCRLAIEMLREHTESISCKMNLFRNFAKKSGMFAYISERKQISLYILDEGAVHTAHNIFVDTTNSFDVRFLKMFSELVSLPDLIIYVRSPRDKLIARTIARGHKRVKKDHDVARFIDNAVHIFEELVSFERIKQRTLVVENAGNATTDIEEISRTICDHIQHIRLDRSLTHI